RQGEEALEQAEVVEDVERGRMDGVPAEIPQEVGVLLQHADLHAGAREQIAEHQSRRAAAGDAALGRVHPRMLVRRRRYRDASGSASSCVLESGTPECPGGGIGRRTSFRY